MPVRPEADSEQSDGAYSSSSPRISRTPSDSSYPVQSPNSSEAPSPRYVDPSPPGSPPPSVDLVSRPIATPQLPPHAPHPAEVARGKALLSIGTIVSGLCGKAVVQTDIPNPVFPDSPAHPISGELERVIDSVLRQTGLSELTEQLIGGAKAINRTPHHWSTHTFRQRVGDISDAIKCLVTMAPSEPVDTAIALLKTSRINYDCLINRLKAFDKKTRSLFTKHNKVVRQTAKFSTLLAHKQLPPSLAPLDAMAFQPHGLPENEEVAKAVADLNEQLHTFKWALLAGYTKVFETSEQAFPQQFVALQNEAVADVSSELEQAAENMKTWIAADLRADDPLLLPHEDNLEKVVTQFRQILTNLALQLMEGHRVAIKGIKQEMAAKPLHNAVEAPDVDTPVVPATHPHGSKQLQGVGGGGGPTAKRPRPTTEHPPTPADLDEFRQFQQWKRQNQSREQPKPAQATPTASGNKKVDVTPASSLKDVLTHPPRSAHPDQVLGSQQEQEEARSWAPRPALKRRFPHQRLEARMKTRALNEFIHSSARWYQTNQHTPGQMQLTTSLHTTSPRVLLEGSQARKLPVKVHNLASKQLSPNVLEVLNLGLTFIPTSHLRNDDVSRKHAMELMRKLSWQAFNWLQCPDPAVAHAQQERDRTIIELRYKFNTPSQAWPNLKNISKSANLNTRKLGTDLIKIAEALESIIAKRTMPPHTMRTQAHNLSKAAQNALDQILQDQDITIVPADKNLGPVILDTTAYVQATASLLTQDSNFREVNISFMKYKQLILRLTQVTLDPTWAGWTKLDTQISRHLINYIHHCIQRAEKIPTFYSVPKIHKTPLKFRPIVPGKGTLLEPLAKIADFFLQPQVVKMNTYIKNSFEFLGALKTTLSHTDIFPEYAKPNYQAWIFTSDVVNLYPSIPIAQALQSVYQSSAQTPDTALLVNTLATITLEHNVVTLLGKTYRQISGVATGSPLAPTAANLFLSQLEDPILLQFIHHVWMKRYIDDIFGIFVGTKTQRNKFISTLSHANKAITFEWKWYELPIMHTDISPLPGNSIPYSAKAVFLDTEIQLTGLVYKQGRLHLRPNVWHSPYQKEANNYVYLTPSSCHPRHTIVGWITGELTRLHRLSYTHTVFTTFAKAFYNRLLDRGYHKQLITDIFAKWKPPNPQSRRKSKGTHLGMGTSTYITLQFNSTALQNELTSELKQLNLSFTYNGDEANMRKTTVTPTFSVGKSIFRLLKPRTEAALGAVPNTTKSNEQPDHRATQEATLALSVRQHTNLNV